jgi:hypothetical protein
MQKLVTLNPSTSPDNVLTFDIVTGEVQYSPKANIATPTTVTLTQATGKTIAKINNTEIKETITDLGKPTLAGNILSIPFTNENGIVKTETVDLSSILAGLGQSTTTYNPATKKIKITKPDATFVEIDLSDLIDPNQVTDGISLKGTGTVADPFRIDFATRAMLDSGTDTTHAINVLELKNQIQTNQYKFGKGVAVTADPNTVYNVTLDYPITTLKDGENLIVNFDKTNNDQVITQIEDTNAITDGNGNYPIIDVYTPNKYTINVSGTGAKKLYKRIKTFPTQIARVQEITIADITPKTPISITYDKTLDVWFVNDLPSFDYKPNDVTAYIDQSNGFTVFRINNVFYRCNLFTKDLTSTTTLTDTDCISVTNNSTSRKITFAELKKLIQPKKFYVASTPLIAGETTITHNLGLVAPFDFLSDFRDPITGASVGLRIKVGSKTANSFIVISNIATAVEITARA